jgi:soluble lytic murein transglycosylase
VIDATARRTTILCLLISAIALAQPRAEQRTEAPASALAQPLTATAHPSLPDDPFELWLAPTDSRRRTGPAVTSLKSGIRLLAESRYTEALPLVRAKLAGTPLADYAQYYTGLTELRLARYADARRTFEAMMARPLVGYLSEAVRLRDAEAAEAQGDAAAAAEVYTELASASTVNPPDVLMRLAGASLAAGNRQAGAAALARVYFEYPLSEQAALAQAALDEGQLWAPLERGNRRYQLELRRVELLFSARRYGQARSGFELLQPIAAGDDAELVALRLAESDHYLKRYRAARAALEPWTRKASRRAEAQFFYLTATRELGQHDEYVRLARELVAAHPQESWAEETLNNLATHFILVDEDDRADGVFRELLERYPESRHAQRAAWKAGWRAYRQERFRETVRIFETAAARFPRSDYRPMWLYWAARAHDRLGDAATANQRYGLVVQDYQNSYYGRLATRQLDTRKAAPPVVPVAAVAQAAETAEGAALPPNHALIRQLIAHELYDDAMNELQYAQRVWGDSPAIQATIGLVHSRRGELRRGINAMKRAYPQYIAGGGEQLPAEMLKVLFPLDYWTLIQRHAKARGLDPYLVAALMAQESTFDAGIRSHANAVGLMQVLPSTGRRYARRIGIRRFSPRMLTQPETNVRLGTTIFADLVTRFGGTHLALASYNAGEGAVSRWLAERGRMEREEFIDDIPYPETQNYVKKILGTAEDYRQLYGTLGASTTSPAKASPAKGTSGKAPAKKKAVPKKKTRSPVKKG